MERYNKLQANSKFKIDLSVYVIDKKTLHLLAQNSLSYKESCLGEHAIGHEVKVYWYAEKTWYGGIVTRFNTEQNEYTVLYQDGEEYDEIFEDLLFSGEYFNSLREGLKKSIASPDSIN